MQIFDTVLGHALLQKSEGNKIWDWNYILLSTKDMVFSFRDNKE